MNLCIKNYNDVKHILTNDSIIFDIGLNIGDFTELICIDNNYSKIYAFEPVNVYYNYAKNRLDTYKNINIYNLGLGNKNEVLPIYIAGKGHKGWNTFLKKDPNQKEGFYNNMISQKANIITLDKFCEENDINKIDFIKIDVEGFECKVIEGFLNILRTLNDKPYIYIEVGWGTKHPEWDYCYDIYNKLFKIGYKPVKFKNRTEDILFEPINSKP